MPNPTIASTAALLFVLVTTTRESVRAQAGKSDSGKSVSKTTDCPTTDATTSVAKTSDARENIAWFGTLASAQAEAARIQRPIFLIAARPECRGVPGFW